VDFGGCIVATEQDELANRQAMTMLETFASVGVATFNLYALNDENKMVPGTWKPGRSLEHCRRCMGAALRWAADRHYSLTVQPRTRAPRLVQLDDLDAAKVKRVEDMAFLILRTSPDNFQAWLAAVDAADDLARRLKAGVGADKGASGATRIAGTVNWKAKYAPDFPQVVLTLAAPEKTVRQADLEAGGLLETADPSLFSGRGGRACRKGSNGERYAWRTAGKAVASMASTPPPRCRPWEVSYAECLAKAPPRRDGTGPDVSLADWAFACQLAKQGRTEAEIAAALMLHSEKGRED
jgi:RepB DNA-primase from phage plasmid